MDYVGTLTASIIVAIISSWLTTKFALRNFRTEKWWERKADAYSIIIGHLYNTKITSEKIYEAMSDGRVLPPKEKDEFDKIVKLANEELQKYIATGTFILSNDALIRLKLYQNHTRRVAISLYDYLDNDINSTNTCIDDLVVIAKKDLDIK